MSWSWVEGVMVEAEDLGVSVTMELVRGRAAVFMVNSGLTRSDEGERTVEEKMSVSGYIAKGHS